MTKELESPWPKEWWKPAGCNLEPVPGTEGSWQVATGWTFVNADVQLLCFWRGRTPTLDEMKASATGDFDNCHCDIHSGEHVGD